MMMRLSQDAVRSAMLAAQGLHAPPPSSVAKGDLLPVIRKMGYLQIDTIQAIRRSQYLVLWSRLGDYCPDWLDEVHAEGHLFEYYAHALCYLPIEDYRIFRGRILHDGRIGNGWQKWAEDHPEVVKHVRSVILDKGPVCSADFDSHTISSGWGSVKREKLALQRMFSTGDLMVPYRRNFRRYYDLRERVLPEWNDADALSAQAATEALVLKAVYALGVGRLDWVASYYYLPKTELEEILAMFVKKELLYPVQVEGWDTPAYVHPDQWSLVAACAAGDMVPSQTTLLSPFDPLIADRDRALTLFGFDYRMESYTPAKDRQYGYFSLPILYHDQLAGRLDPKAHRNEGRMEIKNIYLEPGVAVESEFVNALKTTLENFTRWHGLKALDIKTAQPAELLEALL